MLEDYRFEMKAEVEHPRLINTRNGVIDLVTGEIAPSSSWQFLYVLDFHYDKKATLYQAPTFKNFLCTSLGSAENQKLFLECLGYCISDSVEAQKAIFFYGESGTGKSVILNLVKRLIGEENVTNILLNDIGSRFNKAELAGSRINICTEMNGGKFVNEGVFKAIVSNEPIMAERKGEDPFIFKARTKLLTAGNSFPTFHDGIGMEAILRRIVVVKFDKKISNKDSHLEEKLWNERDVIFSLAIKSLIELKKKGFVFTQPKSSTVFLQSLQRDTRAFDDFVETECILSADRQAHLVKIIQRFKEFCDDNAYSISLSNREISERISGIEGVSRSRFRSEGKSLWGFKGIGLKPPHDG